MTRTKPETALVSQCLNYLQLRGIPSWRNNSGAVKVGKQLVRFGQVGSPDILGILPFGRLLAIECKVGRNKLSPAQEDWLERARVAGARCEVIRSLDELMAIL